VITQVLLLIKIEKIAQRGVNLNKLFSSHNLLEHLGKERSLQWFREVVGCHIRCGYIDHVYSTVLDVGRDPEFSYLYKPGGLCSGLSFI
jgi:hypothetical protein